MDSNPPPNMSLTLSLLLHELSSRVELQQIAHIQHTLELLTRRIHLLQQHCCRLSVALCRKDERYDKKHSDILCKVYETHLDQEVAFVFHN